MKVDCNRVVQLEKFGLINSKPQQIFFVETSGKSDFMGRQVCAMESAALKSGLHVQVIMTSKQLRLSDSNSTCQLYHSSLLVSFYTVDVPELFQGTPVEGLEKRINMSSKFGYVHLSDTLRQAIVFKYGGFYADIDTVVLKDLTELRNVHATQGSNPRSKEQYSQCLSKDLSTYNIGQLNNGHFHFTARHAFTEKLLENANKTYQQMDFRILLGPPLSTKTAKQLLKTDNLTQANTGGLIKFMPDFIFSPQPWNFCRTLYWPKEAHTVQMWEEMFKCSYTVHFYSRATQSSHVTGDSQHEAYSYLAPRFCPLSFYPHDQF